MKSVQLKHYGRSRRPGMTLTRRPFNLPYVIADRLKGDPIVPERTPLEKWLRELFK